VSERTRERPIPRCGYNSTLHRIRESERWTECNAGITDPDRGRPDRRLRDPRVCNIALVGHCNKRCLHTRPRSPCKITGSVLFLAGGNKKEVKQGAQGEGLPSSFSAGRGAYLARPARGMTEASRGIEGTNSKEGEQDRRGRKMLIFRLLCMIEREICYIADRNRVRENRATKGGATELISGQGYTCNG
jgi:hypothetical protein